MGNAIGKIVDELLLLFKKNYKRPRLWIVLGLIMFCCILLLPLFFQISQFFFPFAKNTRN